MSVEDADELNVWFFRATGLSKSHHSCEERKTINKSGLHCAPVTKCSCGYWLGSGIELAGLLLSMPGSLAGTKD